MSVGCNFKKLIGVVGVTACLSMFAITGANAAPDPNFHIYIAYGQSNMEGNATNFTSVDKKEHPRVKMFATTSCSNLGRPTVGEMYPAVPPMFKCNAGLSPADWFGRHMADSLPDVTIGIIPVAQGGTSIRLFDPDDYKNYIASAADWLQSGAKAYGNDGNAMGRIIEVAKKAQEKGVIKGIIFHQGETDGGMSNWEQIVKKTYEYMLKQLGLNAEETPFVAGEMVDGGSCAGFNSRVNNLSKYIVNFGVASSKGYGSKGDGLHFTVEGYRGMGQRYAQEMLKLINVEPVEPEPQTPYGGKAVELPGKIEAENFDVPGKGSGNNSYSVASTGQGNSDYRSGEGVNLYKKESGAIVIGYNQTGNYYQYTVKVPVAGEYLVRASVATDASGSFVFKVGDKVVSDTIVVEGDSYNKFIDAQGKIKLDAGEQILTLEVTKQYFDIDYFEILKDVCAPGSPECGGGTNPGGDTTTVIAKFQVPTMAENYRIFDMNGNNLGVVRAAGMQELRSNAASLVKRGGVYLARSLTGKILRIQAPK